MKWPGCSGLRSLLPFLSLLNTMPTSYQPPDPVSVGSAAPAALAMSVSSVLHARPALPDDSSGAVGTRTDVVDVVGADPVDQVVGHRLPARAPHVRLELVGAPAAVDQVVAVGGHLRAVAVHRVARPGVRRRVAGPDLQVEVVGAVATEDPVVTDPAPQGVVAVTAEDRVGPASAVGEVGSAAEVQGVVAVTAPGDVRAAVGAPAPGARRSPARPSRSAGRPSP